MADLSDNDTYLLEDEIDRALPCSNQDNQDEGKYFTFYIFYSSELAPDIFI